MTSEVKSSYVSSLPLDVVWKMTKAAACDKIMVKVLPSHFGAIDIVQGGGGVGTVRVVTLGEGVGPEGVGQKIKEHVDVVDEATHTVGIAVVEGGDPRYTNVRFTLKVSPAGDSTAIDWIAHYTPVDASVPPPHHYKSMADATNDAMEAYGKAHASEFA